MAVRKVSTPLWELTCHMGSHSVTCHPAEATFPPLPQPKLVLDSATPEGCKAELTQDPQTTGNLSGHTGVSKGYSVGGSSDAAFRCQYCSELLQFRQGVDGARAQDVQLRYVCSGLLQRSSRAARRRRRVRGTA